jgi:hypothetical protein
MKKTLRIVTPTPRSHAYFSRGPTHREVGELGHLLALITLVLTFPRLRFRAECCTTVNSVHRDALPPIIFHATC